DQDEAQRAESADHEADEQAEREADRERVRVDRAGDDREQRPRDARVERRERERTRLVERGVDAHRDRRDLAVANCAERPPAPIAMKAPCPSEIWPLYPVSTASPRIATTYRPTLPTSSAW